MRNLTGWLCSGIFLLCLVLDAFLPGWGYATESQWLRDTAWHFNAVAGTGGFLIGHWFFNRYSVSFSAWGFGLAFLLGELAVDLVVLVWFPDLLDVHQNARWWRYPGWHALAGIPVGMFLWGQPYDKSPF